eukprot:2488246-Pyramimonas_sp.AAC.1
MSSRASRRPTARTTSCAPSTRPTIQRLRVKVSERSHVYHSLAAASLMALKVRERYQVYQSAPLLRPTRTTPTRSTRPPLPPPAVP